MQYSSYSATYLVVISKNPAETLHVGLDHLFTKFIIGLIYVEFVFVVPLLPAGLPQPIKLKQPTVNLREKR